MKKPLCILLSLLSVLTLCSCGAKPSKAEALMNAADDIFTYKPVDFKKTVITLGKYDDMDLTPLENAIEERFPNVDFVFSENAGGQAMAQSIIENGVAGKLEDFIICRDFLPECDDLYDLSGEAFSGRFNLSALESNSINGKLYQLPLTSTITGIFYNKTLFDEHGWQIPETLDEFYALCAEIEAAGIRAFAPCFKYITTIQGVCLGLSRNEVLSSADKVLQLEDYANRTTSCKNLLEPLFDAAARLGAEGLVTADDFTSSATKNRLAVYAGEIAMIPYNYSFVSFYEQEKPDCEIGMFGYPSDVPGERYMDLTAGTNLAVSAQSMEDQEKKQIILDILDYMTTNEGQEVLFQCISGVSNVTSYQTEIHTRFQDMYDCLAEGRCFTTPFIWNKEAIPYFLELIEGKRTSDELVEIFDALPLADAEAYPYAPSFATATDEFTVLDTSCFYADVMRELSGADIAIMLNRSYFGGNLTSIHKGDISVPSRFYIKGLTAEDCLTTYSITGENLKKMLEHPMMYEKEIVELYAVSGLKVEYAPWAAADANVLSVTLADGTPSDDNATYTVAALATTIDARYITETVKQFSEVGTPQEMMTNYITAAGTIAPAKDGRITLNWQTQ